MHAAQIEPARADDLDGVLTLLGQSGLPVDGASQHLGSMLVVRDRGRVAACAALELYGEAALLRSVAVDASLRGTGVGQALTRAALDMAAARGVRSVFLLTTTAEEFFPKFGFVRVARGEVPAAVQQSVEFTSACPASAVVMALRLGRGATD